MVQVLFRIVMIRPAHTDDFFDSTNNNAYTERSICGAACVGGSGAGFGKNPNHI